MKTKLLLSLFLMTAFGFAQNPIALYVHNQTSTDSPTYFTVTASSPLNHTAGANQIWNFEGFTTSGHVFYNYPAPTPSEISTYPGTTDIMVSTFNSIDSDAIISKLFTRTDANNTFSITGLVNDDFTINFSTNNATVGTFPMTYGYTNTDNNVAGTYAYDTYSGTFTGNMVTTVDAYGELNFSANIDDNVSFSYNATRLKTVLTLSMNYSFFSNAGTVTQTIYSYYPDIFPAMAVLRSTTTSMVSSLLSIDETNTTLEVFQGIFLKNNNLRQNSFWIKNPIQNNIEINASQPIENANISITDMLGKTIYSAKNTINETLEIPISLNKGIYLITISDETNTITKKVIKN